MTRTNRTRRFARDAAAFLIASFLLVASFAPRLDAQTASQTDRVAREGSIRETVTVRETTMFVRVLRSNRPVPGLEADDFRVSLEGQDLEIVALDELDARPTRSRREKREGEAQAEDDAAAGRSLLVVFDQLFLQRGYAQAGVDGLRRSLAKLGPADRVAVVMLGTRAVLVQPFTDRRESIDAALDFVEASIGASRSSALRALARLDELSAQEPGGAPGALDQTGLRAALALGTEVGWTLSALPDPTLAGLRLETRIDVTEGPSNFDLWSALAANQVVTTVEASHRALSDLLRLFADVPGPRYALLLSRGVPEFANLLEDGIGSGPGVPRSGAGAALLASIQSLAYVLEGYGWTVQAFDLTGVGGRGSTYSDVSAELRPELNSLQIAAPSDFERRGGLANDGSDSLFFLAAETGGDLYDNFNRLNEAFDRALDRTRHYYRVVVLLPSDPELFAKRRRQTLNVEVTNRRSGLRVISSMAAEWSLPGNLRRVDPVDLVRAELLGQRETRTLPLQVAHLGVFRAPIPERERLQRAVLVLDASKLALFPKPPPAGEEAVITVHAIALPRGAAPGTSAEFLDLWSDSAALQRAGGVPSDTLVVIGDLVIPCEGAVVRMRVADATQRTSWLFERVLASECGPEAPRWATPLQEDGAAVSLVVEKGFELDDPGRNPFRIGGETYLPMLRGAAVAGDQARLLVRSFDSAEGSSIEAAADLAITFVDRKTRQRQRLLLTGSPGPEGGQSRAGKIPWHGTARMAVVALDLPPATYTITLGGSASSAAGAVVTVYLANP